MKIKELIFLGFSCCSTLLTSYSAQAQCCNETPWYITLGGGFVFASKTLNNLTSSNSTFFPDFFAPSGVSLFTFPNVNWQVSFKDGGSGNIAFGKNWGEWLAELEFLYENVAVQLGGQYAWSIQDAVSLAVLATQVNNLFSTTSTRAEIGALMVNGAWSYDNPSGFVPYIGGGIGARYLKVTSTLNNTNLNITNPIYGPALIPFQQVNPYISNLSFAAQFKAGLGYEFADNITLMLSYRLFWTPDVESTTSQIVTFPGTPDATAYTIAGKNSLGSLVTNAVELSLRFAF